MSPRPAFCFWLLIISALPAFMSARGQTPGDPVAPQWLPSTVLSWTPASDTDAPYNRSTVPLAARFTNSALNLNSHARPNEGRVMALVAFNSIPAASAQGSRTLSLYATNYWQYIDSFVFWGGSNNDHGIILTPPAHVVDAAHRNGVPIYGKVFFGWGPDSTRLQELNQLLQKSGTSFPVADKLIAIANFYGFDGWFINQETYGASASNASDMRDFIAYMRQNAPTLKTIWYDAMDQTGNINFQNAINSQNGWYMMYNSQPVASMMFLNFWWYYSSNLANSNAYAKNNGINPYAVYAGIDTEGAGYTTKNLDWASIFPEGSPHTCSLGIYRPEWTYNVKSNSISSNLAAFYSTDNYYWVGPAGDPANTTVGDTNGWHGIAHYIPATSPITTLPFFTNFNTGEGLSYSINGNVLQTGEWNNLGVQDILPTWRWAVSGTGAKLTPQLTFDSAYYGGTSLKVSGTLNATNDIKLYQTSLPVSGNTKFRIVYTTGSIGATSMQVGLSFTGSESAVQYISVPATTTSGWNTADLPLSAYASQTIAAISLRFSSSSANSSYSIRIGQLGIYDGTISTPAAPSNVSVKQITTTGPDTVSMRLTWNPSSSAVYYYNVYTLNPDGSRSWLGTTHNTAYFVPRAKRQALQTSLNIQVEAVAPDFGVSTSASATVAMPIQGFVPLTGTAIGSGFATGTSGFQTGYLYALDGDPNTYYEANTANPWVGLDLGAGTGKVCSAISFYPRTNWSIRMASDSPAGQGQFEGANNADFSDSVVLYKVAVKPPEGEYTTVILNNTKSYRYLRYTSVSGTEAATCNVADVVFYQQSVPNAPTFVNVIISGGSASLSWPSPSAPGAATYTVKRSNNKGGPYSVIASGISSTSYIDSGLTASPYYYVISASNALGEGPNSPETIPTTLLTGTIIGTDGSYGNSGRTKATVFDGDTTTFFDSPSGNNSWVGWDFGTDHKNAITMVSYCPRTSYASRMVGGVFQGSTDAAFSNPATLATVSSTPADSQYTSLLVTNTNVFQYVRYVSPSNGYCNVAELRFYGRPEPPLSPVNLSAVMVDGTTSLNWSVVTNATSYNVRRTTTSGSNYQVIASSTGNAYSDNGVALGGTYYYVVCAATTVIEGANSSEVTASDAYMAWLQKNGMVPGTPGTNFNDTANGTAVANGIRYAAPTGVQLSSASAKVSVTLRSDPAITAWLLTSTDLVNWNPMPISQEADQTGIPTGFIRYQAPLSPSEKGRFFRLQLSR